MLQPRGSRGGKNNRHQDAGPTDIKGQRPKRTLRSGATGHGEECGTLDNRYEILSPREIILMIGNAIYLTTLHHRSFLNFIAQENKKKRKAEKECLDYCEAFSKKIALEEKTFEQEIHNHRSQS